MENGYDKPQPQWQVYRQPTPPPQRYQQPQKPAYTAPISSASSSGAGGYGGGFQGFRGFDLSGISLGAAAAVLIAIGLAVTLFGNVCGGSGSACAGSGAQSSACVSSSGFSDWLPSKELNVNFDVGYFSDGTFDNAMIVVDNKYYNYLDDNVTNKFAAELKKGKHTVCVEYYRNGTACATDSLEFKIRKKDELVDLLVYPYGEKLTLVFSDT